MTSDKGILIKNIYYMLTYAFQVLRQSTYENIEAEEFENIHDMFAAILGKGISSQLKQGLYREYVGMADDLVTMRGKLDLPGTIKNRILRKQVLACEFDELSENNLLNQILKTTMMLLIKEKSVREDRRAVLKKSLLFFGSIDDIEPHDIRWERVPCHRNNRSYKILLNICRLVIDGMLLSTEKGDYKLAGFLDAQRMSHLYEKFILEYYRYHHPELRANPDQVKWNLDDDNDLWLPNMITDITLKKAGKTLIIDAKYYEQQMQSSFDVPKFRNANLYQLFTYVKNMDTEHDGSVAGMLLYAKTGEEYQPSNKFNMDGNEISIGVLDLSVPFSEISNRLEDIVESYFG